MASDPGERVTRPEARTHDLWFTRQDHDDCKTKSPVIPVRSTEVSETRLVHILATYEHDGSNGSEPEPEVTNLKVLMTSDFKDSLKKTCFPNVLAASE